MGYRSKRRRKKRSSQRKSRPITSQDQQPITLTNQPLDDDDDDINQQPLPFGGEDYASLLHLVLGYDPLVPYPTSAGPALEVMSITIFNPTQSPVLIYGEITTTDYLKTVYYFYKDHNKDNLQLVRPGWKDLDLFECPIAPVMGGNVHFKLNKNRSDDKIFDEVYDMNKAIERDDGTFFLEGRDGNSGYRFEMIFTKIPYAIIAKVEMFVKSTAPPPSSGRQCYPIHGTITTNKFACFKTLLPNPVWLEYEKQYFLPTRRNLYAVSIDSTVDVEVELYSRTLFIAKQKLEIEATQYVRPPPVPPSFYFDSKLDGYTFFIQVEWIFHRVFFRSRMEGVSKPYAIFFSKPSQPRIPGALVEVYSVFSCRGNSSALRGNDLDGEILVCNGEEIFNILARKEKCPGDLLKNDEQQRFRTLSLKWPDGKWVVGEKFKLYLKLKDVNDNMVRVGVIGWRPDCDSRYDCRLCDTFSGDEGYFAAVHYSVFKHGKKAKVFVECSNINGPLSIYGSVYAKYNNYDYSSTYDEEFYRSMLFKRSKEDAMEVTSEISLLKNQVSAPSDCDELIVCVDLWVRPFSSSLPHQRYTFNTNETKSCDMAQGSLMVKVVWV